MMNDAALKYSGNELRHKSESNGILGFDGTVFVFSPVPHQRRCSVELDMGEVRMMGSVV